MLRATLSSSKAAERRPAEHDLGAELSALSEGRVARVAPEEHPGRRERERAEATVVRDHVDVPVRPTVGPAITPWPDDGSVNLHLIEPLAAIAVTVLLDAT